MTVSQFLRASTTCHQRLSIKTTKNKFKSKFKSYIARNVTSSTSSADDHKNIHQSTTNLLNERTDLQSHNRHRIGIGGSKLARNNDHTHYASVIATSLQNGCTTFEAGLGGDDGLFKAYTDAVAYLNDHASKKKDGNDNDDGKNNNDWSNQEVILTGRFGYRTEESTPEGYGGDDDDDQEKKKKDTLVFPNDVPVPTKNEENDNPNNQIKSEKGGEDEVVYHNISKEFVAHCLNNTPLTQLTQPNSPHYNPNLHLVYMAHNPEAQGSLLAQKGAPIDEVRGFIKERMIDTFIGLETGVAEGKIHSYGVCSNGLSLPSSHPLHLSWIDVLCAAEDAVRHLHHDAIHSNYDNVIAAKLSTLQLPCNLLETYALKVALRAKDYLASSEEDDDIPRNLPKSVNIYITRPLTCFPDRGTGNGHPFKLVDYLLPTSLDGSTPPRWTHDMPYKSIPQHYSQALNAAMGHFDATHLLEIETSREDDSSRQLSTEERETIEGCRLLQSMLHDLDVKISSRSYRSLAAYDEELMKDVIPMIHNTFEELDEDSELVLRNFFQAHGHAVRHCVASTTRESLLTGGEGVTPYDVPSDSTLQEFALQWLLEQKCSGNDTMSILDDNNDKDIHPTRYLVDRVIVGCPRPEHVIEAIKAADSVK